ncbi:hypothetical protein [Oryzicola mucosus]|uniref:Uncharacterized protein n=1 Tax=Oryzicola mucosus TaxID=2767425 RepID=A0A8J6PWE9_9HYPH|nr:hypothetical protein [Oryzicola mucosus]MBD0417554.1 hypothetical protein [Oryzicola mucosus]
MIITLSSIPSRFQFLPRFFNVLASQELKPEAVELYVARRYRRFPGEVPALPPLPDWVTVTWIDEDIGPASKVLPACRKWAGRDIDILYCDDDHAYDRMWAMRFQQQRDRMPDVALCEKPMRADDVGLERKQVSDFPRGYTYLTDKTLYKFVKLATLGFVRLERKRIVEGYADIMEGYAGCMVKPDWLADADFDIPDVFWTVDDIWLSGILAVKSIKIHTTKNPVITKEFRDAHLFASPLWKHIENGIGRHEANRRCAVYMSETHGIWK